MYETKQRQKCQSDFIIEDEPIPKTLGGVSLKY
jgi:hypothetical protein